MLDFTRIDPRLLDDVGAVTDELVRKAEVDPESIMLVGARCRDALHAALGHQDRNRATNDLDIGIALESWAAFERIDQVFERTGSNGIRFVIWGVSVDVMPFGTAIENPAGVATPGSRGDGPVVFGFDDVFARGQLIQLPGAGHRIRIPEPAGYAALKLRAWVDRSVDGEYKDAEDFAIVQRWYADWEETADRLYGAESDIADMYAYDMPLAEAHLLGEDIRRQLSEPDADDLVLRFGRSNVNRFGAALRSEVGNPGRRSALVAALASGLGGRFSPSRG